MTRAKTYAIQNQIHDALLAIHVAARRLGIKQILAIEIEEARRNLEDAEYEIREATKHLQAALQKLVAADKQ